MDALTSLVTALAAGAAAALKPTVEQAVKDSYTGVPGVIRGKFSVKKIATKPPSVARHDYI